MRVVLVGRPADRERLRSELAESGLQIVGEAATLAAAREIGFPADGFLIASADAGGAHRPLPDGRTRETAVESLTPREVEVLQLVAIGLPNRRIADRLGISDQTVKFHVASILGKLGAANRTDAVRRATRRGIIDL